MPGRYSQRPFPPYRYVPGRSPHPLRDPRGHAFGASDRVEPLDPTRWLANDTWLYAVDLFNHGYWWEAHEALEGLWKEAGRRSETGVFLQGLIQAAAALLKHAMEQPRPARRLAARAAEKLRTRPVGFLGIDGADLATRLEARVRDETSDPVVIRLQGAGARR